MKHSVLYYVEMGVVKMFINHFNRSLCRQSILSDGISIAQTAADFTYVMYVVGIQIVVR